MAKILSPHLSISIDVSIYLLLLLFYRLTVLSADADYLQRDDCIHSLLFCSLPAGISDRVLSSSSAAAEVALHARLFVSAVATDQDATTHDGAVAP